MVHRVEHRFAREDASDLDPVEAADQPIFLVPHLDTEGVSHPMQFGVGGEDAVVYPRPFPRGAAGYDLVEGGVGCRRPILPSGDPPNITTHAHFGWIHHRSRIRGEPGDQPPQLRSGPGKPALAVSMQNALSSDFEADGLHLATPNRP